MKRISHSVYLHLELSQNVEKAAGEKLNEELGKARSQERPVLLLCSGGSALKLLSFIDVSLLGPSVTVAVLDERFTDVPSVNNFMQLKGTIFDDNAEVAKVAYISTIPHSSEDLETFSQRFETSLQVWLDQHPNGVVIAIQGIGNDGHTAGIMPMTDSKAFTDMFETQSLVHGYDSRGTLKPSKRVTTTITFLEKYIDASIVFVVGKSKEETLLKILDIENKDAIHELPGRVIHHMKKVHIYTDIDLSDIV